MCALAAFYWFYSSATNLVSQFRSESQVIVFEKGSMLMLGCGLSLLFLTLGGICEGLLGWSLTPKSKFFFANGVILSLIIMFLFPQFAHYCVAQHADKHNYFLCEDAVSVRGRYVKIYYTKNRAACDALVKQKKR